MVYAYVKIVSQLFQKRRINTKIPKNKKYTLSSFLSWFRIKHISMMIKFGNRSFYLSVA
jgi:hypothetical protein